MESVLHGYNGSIIAYGQTGTAARLADVVHSPSSSLGTGKSYSIEGGITEESRGVIPRASEEIFDCI